MFTGCDTGSAFVGKGKVRPLKLMQGSTKHIQTFKQLGVVADTLPSDVMEGLENCVCSLYGSPKANSTSAVRYQLFQSRFGAQVHILVVAINTVEAMVIATIQPH